MLRKNSCLQNLEVDSNDNLSGEGCREIFQGLKVNRSLIELHMNHCYLEDNDLKAVAGMLRENQTLRILEVDRNESLKGKGCTEICRALRENRSLTELRMSCCYWEDSDLEAVAEMLWVNQTLRVLEVFSKEERDKGSLAIAKALVGHRSLHKLQWPNMSDEVGERCAEILLEGNGSLVDCEDFEEVCKRNHLMHERAREAVQTLRVLRWRDEEKKRNIFHMLQKDVVEIICRFIWASKTEVDTWSLKKTTKKVKSKKKRKERSKG